MKFEDEESKELQKQRLERRRQKFSEETRDNILNSPLRDEALLSKSTNAGIESLVASQDLREKFLCQLKHKNADQREHGLRKLREIIVSIYDQNKSDRSFVEQAYEVYKMSYDFYLQKRDFNKVANLVLSFMVTHLPLDMTVEYAEINIISLSHVTRDMDMCIRSVRDMAHGSTPSELLNSLLEMSVIYMYQTSSPRRWFKILSAFDTESPIYSYVTRSKAFMEMRRRNFEQIAKCYNQIPVGFLIDRWFSNMITADEVRSLHDFVTTPNGAEVIVFKKRR